MRKAVCNSPQYKRFNSVDALPEMCTTEDLSNFFAVTPGTIYNWRQGKNCKFPLPFINLPGIVRFRKADVKEFYEKHLKGAS